jgi:di/tricarboxylate transporter
MGAGNNRATDHQKVGTPLTVFVILILLFLTPLFFPF